MSVYCSLCGRKQDSESPVYCISCGATFEPGVQLLRVIVSLNDHGNLFRLAEAAFEGGNYEEAVAYYNRCLEIDSNFFEAWYKKGVSTLLTSTLGELKFNQALSCIRQAIEYSPNSERFRQRLRIDMTNALAEYYRHSLDYFLSQSPIPCANLDASMTNFNHAMRFVITELGLSISEIKTAFSKIDSALGTKLIEVTTKGKFNCDTSLVHKTQWAKLELLKEWRKTEPETAPKTLCFVATAVIGDNDHVIVKDFRKFRDTWLMHRRWGVSFINWYYQYGPIAAAFVQNKKYTRFVILMLLLKPLHFLIKRFAH